ncbi:uncharacterized protein Z520_09407 [Fonsecaea multimorphosa CBS 102226]|uniref:Uncharacterized protein n=1 Tax=Fonsecaea multimorphosa CBS 102226 TaxID=1442371 RepID=A0A0D2JMZ9_9EURO|nr:uncharacterized protein Z520_09407 [Fonsecaea multimorphosa CBS 102226]KIX94717.1 hypothetical protein Z520_09407 [Fonsecaea multimorphosa CBS 102226]OAL20492.1 hypothetical protein AYO22_08793 [Fonsecaea multimorphosa]
MDEDDNVDNATSPENHNRQSRRERLKGALARTKSKFKKNTSDTNEERDLPDDVNEFLAAGRTSTSSSGPWHGDSLPPHPIRTNTNATSLDQSSPASTRPSTSESFTHPSAPQRSPKKVPIPRIDVSSSQRWPRAQPIGTSEQDINDFLRPEYQGRSQSVSSFSNKPKRKGRGRGLSVSFIEAPPVIIGEGGDDAPTPPVEISKARQRARSASPMPSRGGQSQPRDHHSGSPMNGAYGHRNPPIPPPSRPQAHAPPDVLRPRMLQRVQTGNFSGGTMGASALDKEFEMTLRLGPNALNSPVSPGGSPHTPELLAPKPVRVVHPPPPVLEEPAQSHVVKNQVPSTDLRKQFREGDALRMHLDKEAPEIVDGIAADGLVKSESTSAEKEAFNRI